MEGCRDPLTFESLTVYLIRCLETKSLSSNTRIDNGYMYRAQREVRQCRFEDERAHRNVMTFNSMRHINNPKIRIGAKNNSFHFGDIWVSQSEIREQSYRDH